ncbi:MAG: nucleotidyltransferase [Tepidanaerobacteraceae bacterium]|jgi:predicted nucleotidyltransferase|nr:nucleotidyltransferase [Tepidanaerobacteraceae bacterium]
MKIVGIIAEYNPLHNGHLYHINQIKSRLNPDGIICAMSGNFVQRGEPACFDKWARAEMALHAGADLIMEIPTCFAASTAEIFAESAVRLLQNTGIINILSFGVEQFYEKEFFLLGKLLSREPLFFKELIKKHLKGGVSFPTARQKAIEEFLGANRNSQFYDAGTVSNILKMPNSILALEYIKAAVKINADFSFFPVIRKGGGYNDQNLMENYSSATAIRKALKDNQPESWNILSKNLPDFCLKIIQKEIESGHGPVFFEDFDAILLYMLRRLAARDFANFFDINEGLENRLKKAARSSGNIEQLVLQAKTRRYTQTRIKRGLIHILLGIRKDIVSTRTPLYFRILGFNSKGSKMLKQIKARSSLPIVTRASDYKDLDNDARQMFEIDLLSSDIYALAFKNQIFRKGGADFSRKVILI